MRTPNKFHEMVHRRCCPIFIIAVVSVGCSAIIVTPRCSIPLLSPSSRRETIITSRKNSSIIYNGVNKNNDVKVSLVSLPRRRRRFDNLLFVTRWGGSNDDEKLVTKNNERYYLVWSPNFWRKMLLSMAFWLALQYAWSNHITQSSRWMMSISSKFHACHGHKSSPTYSIAMSLLSSSCCAIQLIINVLTGWGCAGFNSYLGPIRPALLPLLLISTWRQLPHQSRWWTIVSLYLAFLPELVDIYTNLSRQRQKNHSRFQNITNDQSIAASSLSSNVLETKLKLNIPTMGCVACVNKVNASIRGCNSAAEHILDESSWLTGTNGGEAELIIRGRTREEIDQIVEEVVDAAKVAGFRCNVESITKVEKRSSSS
jgi:copper chaperone CopZ